MANLSSKFQTFAVAATLLVNQVPALASSQIDLALSCVESTSNANRDMLKRISGASYEQYPVCIDKEHRWTGLTITSAVAGRSVEQSKVKIDVAFSDSALPILDFITSSFQGRQLVIVKAEKAVVSSYITSTANGGKLLFILPDNEGAKAVVDALTQAIQ